MDHSDRTDITIASIDGKSPRIDPSAFIAPGCRIVGDVEIGPEVSIWYNCVIRADSNFVRIGARTNVQDGSVLHCDGPLPGKPDGCPLIIGEEVLIGHMAMIHGCRIEDRGFVGLGAIAMNDAVIGSDAMLAAGALLTENKVMEPGSLWAGRPAKPLRDLPEAAKAGMRAGVAHYVENGKRHRNALGHED